MLLRSEHCDDFVTRHKRLPVFGSPTATTETATIQPMMHVHEQRIGTIAVVDVSGTVNQEEYPAASELRGKAYSGWPSPDP